MKLAFLFNYPLVDNVDWKKQAIEKCVSLGYNVEVYYGKTRLWEYIKAYLIKRKFGGGVDFSKKVKSKKINNAKFFSKKGVKVHRVNSFNKKKSIDKIVSANYDYLFVAIDHILSAKFVKGIRSKIVNVHYATLPEIKGMNAIEWNYLVNGKCELTLHYIDSGIDTGSIITKEEIIFRETDDFLEIRKKLQNRIPTVLEEFLKETKPSLTENTGGKLYTYMHKDIKKIIAQKF